MCSLPHRKHIHPELKGSSMQSLRVVHSLPMEEDGKDEENGNHTLVPHTLRLDCSAQSGKWFPPPHSC